MEECCVGECEEAVEAVDAVEEKRQPESIEVPDFYKPAVEWQIKEALEFMHKFYSEKSE